METRLLILSAAYLSIISVMQLSLQPGRRGSLTYFITRPSLLRRIVISAFAIAAAAVLYLTSALEAMTAVIAVVLGLIHVGEIIYTIDMYRRGNPSPYSSGGYIHISAPRALVYTKSRVAWVTLSSLVILALTGLLVFA